MRWRILLLSILVTLAAVAMSAQVGVTEGSEPTVRSNGGEPGSSRSVRDLTLREAGSSTRAGAHNPTYVYVVPHFRIDTVRGFGDTTLVAVRNEDDGTNQVEIDINDGVNFPGSRNTLTRTLAAKEVWTLNLRDWTSSIPIDSDGYRRGYVIVAGEGTKQVSVDWFQVNPDEDFAVGGIGVDLGDSNFELCDNWKIRSLVGGGFSGGTTITFLTAFNQCTVSGLVNSESGSLVDDFSFANGAMFSFTVDASTLTSADASTMDISLANCGGGWVGVVHDAEGRYSVGVDGICTD